MKPGTVVRYTPDPSRHDPRWCREGTAIANSRGALVDTYWGGMGQDSHVLNADEIETAERLFHLDDYDELDRRGGDREWRKYRRADRERITSQHGLQVRYFIRKGATPDMETQIENAREAVREAEEEVRSAEARLKWRLSDLAALVTRQESA